MPKSSHIDPATGKDARYALIPVLLEDGKIERLSDIFKFVPKTIVARDMGISLGQWDKYMEKVVPLTLKRLFRLAELCGITERQVLGLVMAEREYQKRGFNGAKT